MQSDGSDPFAAGDQLVLMGFSTEDGKGERVILGKRQSYVKPLLTPRGDRIVFSTRPQGGGPEVFIVAWDGSGLTRLAKGFALAVWENPTGGVPWVYVGSGNKDKSYDFPTVSRFPIDAPSKTEVVWNKTLVSADTFQLSADGRFAAGLFPWPHAGVAELPNKSLEPLGEGCWTAMTTARGPIAWYFDGAHRNVTLVDVRTKKRWTIALNQAPGFQNPEVYHPRWTNHPRFIALSGPYNQGGANQVRSGGTQSEVWLGRFSEDFSRIEAWTRATTNSGGDSYPDVWIDRDKSPLPCATGRRRRAGDRCSRSGHVGKPGDAAATRAVVDVRLAHAGPIPTPESILPYRHALVVNAYDVVTVVEGQYAQKTIHVAQWAIRDGKVLAERKEDAGRNGAPDRRALRRASRARRRTADHGPRRVHAAAVPRHQAVAQPDADGLQLLPLPLLPPPARALCVLHRSDEGEESRAHALQLRLLRLGEPALPVPAARLDAARLHVGPADRQVRGRLGRQRLRRRPERAAVETGQDRSGDLGRHQPVAPRLLQVLQLRRRELRRADRVDRAAGAPARHGAAGHAAARHQLLHVPVDELRHRRLSRPGRRDPELHRLRRFVSMFPQLVAGPIIRFSELADQIRSRTHTITKFARGVAFFSLGLAKKMLLANPCGKIADLAFDAGSLERRSTPGTASPRTRFRSTSTSAATPTWRSASA